MTDCKDKHAKGNSDKKSVGMSDQQLKREKRRQHALERLGTNTPRCVNCGETDWRCLERDHLAGRKFDDTTVVLCRNCHRKKSDDQKDHPEAMSSPPILLDRIGHFLLGLASYFSLFAETCLEFGHALLEYAKTFAEPAEVRS
jgi:hypothetical protein